MYSYFSDRKRAFVCLTACLALAAALLPAAQAAKPVVDSMRHDIGIVSAQNWDSKINKLRDSSVSIVLFYKRSCKECLDLINGEYNALAKKLKGTVGGILAIDCEENAKTCKDQIEGPVDAALPLTKIFPLFPVPPFTYQGPKTVAGWSKALRPLIPSALKSIPTEKDLEILMNSDVQVPKVLFFSDKATQPPVLAKALSNAFKDKLHMAFLNKDTFPQATKKYRVNKFPHIAVIRTGKKDEVFSGEFEFQPLFDWLNVFSETFVLGGGFSEVTNSAPADPQTEPWKFETIPEMTLQSHQDICFKKSIKHLCVIYVKNGRSLSDDEREMLETLKEDNSDSSSGPSFKFMWMDLETEKEFAKTFEVATIPSVVVVNTHKKVRFTKPTTDAPVKAPEIRKLLEHISRGDARFKVIPQAKMPKFADRKQADAKKDEL